MTDANAPIRWHIVLWVNFGMLAGCLVAYFILPPHSRLAVFAVCCLIAIVILNTYLFLDGYRRSEARLPLDPAEARRRRHARLLLFGVSWAIILWEIVRRYWWR